ncbi:hypothetical protein ACFW2V_16760 [Streptomyces sp. NPDC058947]|uniref:hypothetical protein n=1 Tax=Streptomyces sp. NPDC058947 TaxID=3346675 RepID=UPI0036A25519
MVMLDLPCAEWRDGDLDSLRRQLDWSTEGILLDVEHNGFWYEGWGTRLLDDAAALDAARRHMAAAPLVPVYAHRYLPAGRGGFGHPVLSMWQTDIICYGLNLVDYMHQEFDAARGAVDENWSPQPTVRF